MVVQVFNTAVAGMSAATNRLNASAQRTVSWGVDKGGVDKSQAGPDVDLGHEAVEQISAKTDFAANAAVIKTADEMTGALLDIIA
ncbi:flagellar basal body rod C-terminal domain-containing protein [Caulobacter soli]|uniref:flagellar basal body rod C-terminal domain-containing protein n=1 Tax=Caulobacter soli TaxID=2708539 RepID=UPI0013EB416C|nr:flagellar basal body rod C-terminal domain-containing protein [Caulobacter soli]